MSVIEDLERKVQSLGDQLDAAKISLHRAKMEQWNLEPGVTVVLKEGREFLFFAARHFPKGGCPWIKAYPKLASGKWSSVTRNVYGDWTIKDAPVATEASR